jgi:hypothetical protein
MATATQRRDDEDFYGSVIAVSLHDWFPRKLRDGKSLNERWQMPQPNVSLCAVLDYEQSNEAVAEELTTEERFLLLADEWEQDVSNISSLTAMVEHPKYREIVNMKWSVVPFLVKDLERNKRFWLPALEEITGIQPFDASDSGNTKRMIDAWVRWGRHKYKNQIG